MLKINQNRQSDVTAFVNMAAALPAGVLATFLYIRDKISFLL
jgi:hypothetical protein